MEQKCMVDRRRSNDFRQLSVYIRKDLYKKFRATLVMEEVLQSEAVEQALEKWLQEIEMRDA